MVPSVPYRRVKTGVRTENTPNDKTGKLINMPKSVFERPVSALISGIRGPTPAIDGLKLIAIKTIAIKRIIFRFCSGDINLSLMREKVNNSATN
jgi:hypothetical protein